MLTKLDVLDGIDPIPVCVAYQLNGERTEEMPAATWKLEDVEPVIEEMEGWHTPTDGVERWEDLPEEARRYVQRLSELVGCNVGMASVGAERDAIVRVPGGPMDSWIPL